MHFIIVRQYFTIGVK